MAGQSCEWLKRIVGVYEIHAISFCIPIPPAIYFLIDGEEIVYVGKSVVPASRLMAHAGYRNKKYGRVFLLHVPDWDLRRAEAAFIAILRPKHNAVCNGHLYDEGTPQDVAWLQQRYLSRKRPYKPTVHGKVYIPDHFQRIVHSRKRSPALPAPAAKGVSR